MKQVLQVFVSVLLILSFINLGLSADDNNIDQLVEKYLKGEQISNAEKELISQFLVNQPDQRKLRAAQAKINASLPEGPDVIILGPEAFETWVPTGWVVTDNGNGNGWFQSSDAGYTGGFYAAWDDDLWASGSIDRTELTSPAFSTIGYSAISLLFDYSYRPLGSDSFAVEVSNDNGTTWQHVVNLTGTGLSRFPESLGNILDITAQAGENANVLVRFVYDDGGGWNWFGSLDNVSVDGTAAGNPPNPANIVAPLDSAIDVGVTPDLEWSNGGGGPTGYKIFFGTDGGGTTPPTNLENGTDLGNVLLYSPASALAYSTVYYWQIIPYNADGDAVGCPIWEFTTMADPTVSTFPYFEDFETFTVATNATGYANNWSTDPTGITNLFRWNVDAGGTVSGGTGPNADHTSGTATGIYLFTEASSGTAAAEAYVYSPPFDLTGITQPVISFWYHMHGATMGEMHLDVSTDGGLTWTLDVMTPLIGQQQLSQGDPWLVQFVDLTTYIGQTVAVRFRGIRGTSFTGDMAIDDFFIGEAPLPTFAVLPDTGQYGTLTVGDTSAYINFTVSNAGGGTITVNPASALTGADPGEFSLADTNTYPVTLGPGASMYIDVAFLPTSVGAKTANLTITDDLTDIVHDVPLFGEGAFYAETFESFTVASNATGYMNGWSADPDSTTGAFRWNVDAGGTGSSNTGPNVDHTTGTGAGIYLFTEASSGAAGDTAFVYGAPVDISTLTIPWMSFWYHMAGADMGDMHLDVSTDGGATWTLDVMMPLVGAQHASPNDPWSRAVVDLGAFAGQTVSLRWRAIRGASFGGDMAIDDVSMFDAQLGNIDGTVTAAVSGIAIPDAIISVGGKTDTTDAAGFYSITNLLVGTYDVTCTHPVYTNATAPGVMILENLTVTQDFALLWAGISVDPDTFSVALNHPDSYETAMTITNTGPGDLSYYCSITYLTEKLNRSIYSGPTSASLVADENPNEEKREPVYSPNEAIWDLQFAYDVDTPSGLTGMAGAETDGNFLYSTKWSGAGEIVKLDLEGNFIETFTIPGVVNLRDLAYDGQYFYGSDASSYIWEMDFDNKVLVSTITTPTSVRSIAYDSDLDGFWYNNFSTDIHFADRTGTVIDTIPTPPSMYGCAYDNLSEGGPYLWIFTGTSTGGGCQVEQYDLATKTLTGVMHSVDADLGPALYIAGGLFLHPNLVSGTYTLGGLAQGAPDLLFGYELGSQNPLWLSFIGNQSGMVPAGSSVDVGLKFDATGLANTLKTGQIAVSNNSLTGNVIVPADLSVGAPVTPDVVINEIMYNPIESGSDSTEYIEFYNKENLAIDMSGWMFTQGVDHTFPAGTILNPTDYLTISVDTAAMNIIYGPIANLHQWTSGALSNGGEDIVIVDAYGFIVDTVNYDDAPPWPIEPDGNGPSLELIHPNLDNNDGANWAASDTVTAPIGTPGERNSTFDPQVVSFNAPRALDAVAGNAVVDLGWMAPLPAGELGYDDGTSETGLGFTTGGELAVRFTPNVYPSKLLAIKTYWANITDPLDNVEYSIWSNPAGGALAPPTLQLVPNTADSVELRGDFSEEDISTYDITINQGDFFFSWNQPDTINYGIGVDNTANAGRTWASFDGGASWLRLDQFGFYNVMIRAIVQEGAGAEARIVELKPEMNSIDPTTVKQMRRESGHLFEIATQQNGIVGDLSKKSIGAAILDTLQGYELWRSEDDITYNSITTTDTATLVYSDNTVVNGTDYWYYVTANYAGGPSNPSNVAMATPMSVAPVPFFDDFEAYTAGTQLTVQNPNDWTTWSGTPGTGEDPVVSDAFAFSGSNSVLIVQNNDLVKTFGELTSGAWEITLQVYIPNGLAGYFNTLSGFTPNPFEWGMECYFDVGGGGRLLAGSATAITFAFAYDTWQEAKVIVDLDNDWAQFYFDGTMVHEWQWTLGASGGGSALQLDANDFFGATANDQMFFDDYNIESVAPREFFDDFDTYTAGTQLTVQNPTDWTTWSGTPGTGEDPVVSDAQSSSNPNSVLVVQNNDFLKVFESAPITSGEWKMSFQMYIPTGQAGYFNTMSEATVEWAMQVYFDVGGTARLDAGGASAATFPYAYDTWQLVEVIVDLDNDMSQLRLDGAEIYTWQYTLGTFGTPIQLQLDANNFFGATANDQMYMDDYEWKADTTMISGIDDGEIGIPQEYALYQNYPNPFNPTTTIKYDLKQTAKVSLKIYNILGQEVRTLVNFNQEAGYKSIVWDGLNNYGARVASGVYIYRIQTGDFVKAKKMILMK